jgi:hypothetical protein
VSHKPRRDTASDAKELDFYRKENRKLKRQLARAEKRVEKLVSTEESAEDEVPVPLSNEGVDCPSCQQPVKTIQLGVKTLKACKACGWRKVV